jgi:hypothetical protein
VHTPVDYLDPKLPSGLALTSIPVVDATEESLRHYGRLVSDPRECPIEIVRWPARGRRPVDTATGDQGGTTEGVFFFPLDQRPFYVPLARPGDDVTPERFVCFRFDGRHGLYIHPNIWHEGVFVGVGAQRFFDKQGAVHARVSVDFAREFGCLLDVPLPGR